MSLYFLVIIKHLLMSRALSAYMFFVQDYRERIKEENPDASFGEVGKLLGAKWKEMSDAEKKVRVLLFLMVNHSRLALREEGYRRQGPSIRRQGRIRCRREGSCR